MQRLYLLVHVRSQAAVLQVFRQSAHACSQPFAHSAPGNAASTGGAASAATSAPASWIPVPEASIMGGGASALVGSGTAERARASAGVHSPSSKSLAPLSCFTRWFA